MYSIDCRLSEEGGDASASECGTPMYTQYEGFNLANQKHRKLGVFGRKLGENHSPFYCFSDKYL